MTLTLFLLYAIPTIIFAMSANYWARMNDDINLPFLLVLCAAWPFALVFIIFWTICAAAMQAVAR